MMEDSRYGQELVRSYEEEFTAAKISFGNANVNGKVKGIQL